MTDTMSDVMAGAFARDGECLSGDPACYRNRRGYAPTLTLCAACQQQVDAQEAAEAAAEAEDDN